ncbi:UdgX family uracil-DNA binding protein [Erythrobacter arachoides]|uniref:Type-4 uracil-DNA glycosylase n=1 Tax=Aurantiacibacter arachoides TaxID=1850444 RepID=A0A845A2F2_9SPHN|nr:UdgX family uracil-DNA binding protein [Aurantiacibacter arachoides]MXO93326.1 UdgX family uracil-DNA binding protein [Aurantiacibacter arachoides]GGD50259.1 uracil-DNA glycosylase [Aurantiacibacter arachoides]
MTALQHVRLGTYYVVNLPDPDDFAFWRERARSLIQCDVPPDRIAWVEPGATGSLFSHGERRAPVPDDPDRPVRASKRFVSLAKNAALHSDPERFALLYRMLWRLQSNPRLMEDKADADVRRIEELDKAVRRDAHKMHAFVRFRMVEELDEEGQPHEHYVAWFEPDHHILRREAGFFVRRFASMRWSILTPAGTLHWDGEVLREGPPAERGDAPQGDPAEDLWRKYYASIFNPARLKIGAMLKEMPKKYWKNMPEAALIPELVAGAQRRESAMVAAGELEFAERPETLEAIDKAIHACRQCPIGHLDNQAVMGEGPRDAALMIVGEQPGDQEDLAGRPFVGPAGQVLDAGLEQAGIDRSGTYVTNAVKHFKYVQRGKRRLHQSPTAKEIDTCRWWQEAERAIVKPKLVLALGASAARGLLGKTVSITKARGEPIPLDDGSELWVTAHPSYLLRLDGPAREEQQRLFAADLAAVKERLDQMAEAP